MQHEFAIKSIRGFRYVRRRRDDNNRKTYIWILFLRRGDVFFVADAKSFLFRLVL